MRKGKLIVFYGTNNLGKTTQAKLLIGQLNQNGNNSVYLKYPIYDLEPTGPMINDYLRGSNQWKLNARELQTLFAFNRSQHKPALEEMLEKGTNVVAEDYWGSTVAWGMAYGVEKEYLMLINQNRIQEDLALLFDGERFSSGVEDKHVHENDSVLMQKSRKAHMELGEELKWVSIRANNSVDEVCDEVWRRVAKIL